MEKLLQTIDKYKQTILEAERWLWAHPETGYKEWKTNEYLMGKFKRLGYMPIPADMNSQYGKIPGFIVDIDLGAPGPTVCIVGEVDALDITDHPEAVNGAVHACAHHGQAASMLAIASVLSDPNALEGLCGKIRLMLVPAEEMIQLGYREGLRQAGIIEFYGGKQEFMRRGLFDTVDICIMAHGASLGDKVEYYASYGSNGCIAKTAKYKGITTHAAGEPHNGINAQYAAMIGLQACNALRETFREADTIRFHPIIHGANCPVNNIPAEIDIESFVRGRSVEAIKRENMKLNRALSAGALAMGAKIEIHDRPGYAPEHHDIGLMNLVEECCEKLTGSDKVDFDYSRWGTGSSDFGDISQIMPAMQIYVNGTSGMLHGTDMCVSDPEKLCLGAAKALLLTAKTLLENNAQRANTIIANYKREYASIDDYLSKINEFCKDLDVIHYDDDGNAVLTLI